MRLKFLQTMPSGRDGFPFQAGQIINVPKLTAEFRKWIADRAIVVLQDEPETAVAKRGLEKATAR